jgi:vitamin B12 transporter
MKKILYTVFFLGSAVRLSAQDSKELSLDPVTVTASLLEKRASETGRNITVIRGADLANLPANSLDELLRYLPGLEIQARGPMGSQSDIVLRGGTFQQVLVVLDGLRINDPTTGHFSSYVPISPSEIARIEILKGAASSIYGSEAVGGVVSIITKAFDTSQSGDERVVTGGISAGQYGLWNANLGGTLKRERLLISGGILTNNADGQDLRGVKGYFHNHTASLAARYQIDDRLHVAYRASYDHRDFAAQNFYTAFASDTATERVQGWLHQMEVSRKMASSVLSFKAGYKRTTDRYLFNAASSPNQNVSALWQGLVSWQQTLSEHTDLIAGLHYQRRSIVSNDRGDHTIQQLAPFVSVSHRIGGLILHPSLRFDWREHLGGEIVPQLNVSYKLLNWRIRASGGKTIRDADFTERYNNFNKSVVTGGSVGNPALRAERSFNYELGFDWFVGTNWKVSASYFQRDQKDLIDYVPTAYDQMPRRENLVPEGSYALAMNIASVKTRGGELDAQYRLQLKEHHQLMGMLGLTVLGSNQSGDVPSFYLSSHAKVLLNGSLSYQWKRWNVSVSGLFKQRTPREGSAWMTPVERSYGLINSRVSFGLIPRRVSFYAQADNLANVRYSDLLGAVMPGRWLMGGVKIKL